MVSRDGIITRETLNLIMLVDVSYSMTIEGRIQQLNYTIPKLKNSLISLAEQEAVDVKIRVIAFSDDAKWIVGSVDNGVPIQDVVWTDLEPENDTLTHLAIIEANKSLRKQYLGAHALRPVVILITDGNCNANYHRDYLSAIEEMKKKLAGSTGKEKVTRISIGVSDAKRSELEEFASTGTINDVDQSLVFEVDKAEDLCKVINFAAVSSMYSSISDDGSGNIVIEGDPSDEDFI